MKNPMLLFLFLIVFVGCGKSDSSHVKEKESKVYPTILIHGGAGYIYPGRFSSTLESSYNHSLQIAVDSGYKWLNNGTEAELVVDKVIQLLENDTLFNSGKGAVYTNEGHVELDASIMRGRDLNAGAVSGIQHIEHPISLAHLVMDSSKHVMLSGRGAELFGFKTGMDSVGNELFKTSENDATYKKIHGEKYGTVGCVVLDLKGNLAAGTSTGGMMMKEYGRIGDSPIIGAGTYADNEGCAVSCTGHGEYFIRYAVAHSISIQVANGEKIEAAAQRIVQNTLKNAGGDGGIIALDKLGNYTFEFNTQGMFRGMKNADTTFVAMYK